MPTLTKENLIQELCDVLDKYKVYLDVVDDYDDEENICGRSVEIRSTDTVDGHLPIYISDISAVEKAMWLRRRS